MQDVLPVSASSSEHGVPQSSPAPLVQKVERGINTEQPKVLQEIVLKERFNVSKSLVLH